MKGRSLVFALIIFMLPLTAISGTWMDDFNDGNLDGWRMYENFWMNKTVIMDSGTWIVENGVIVSGDDNPERVYGIVTGDMSWVDYTAEVSVRLSKRLEECQISSGVWLCIRFQLDKGKFGQNDYEIGLWNEDGRSAFTGGYKYMDGDFFNFQAFPIEAKPNVWYRVKMIAEGNHITGFVDNLKVFDLTDSSFASGAVSIAVNGVKAEFDNFMVTGPEIPDKQLSSPVKATGKLATTWGSIKISMISP